jgi:hypothetical protein
MVGVAQLVEHRIVIPVVVGSSPIVHPNFTTARRGPDTVPAATK